MSGHPNFKPPVPSDVHAAAHRSALSAEIETLRAEAEMEPLRAQATELLETFKAGPDVLAAYLRNVRLALFERAQQVFLEVSR